MAYILGQYNKRKNDSSDSFMTLIPIGTAKRKTEGGDSGVDGVSNIFENECVQTETLSDKNNYYFHGKIKRMTSSQTFYIKLINYDDEGTEENLEQYIKTITVAKGDPDEWVDVEFFFTPYSSFDSIIFELQRTVDDYRTEIRYPLIIYEELSIINNLITFGIKSGINLIKLGVQSRPHLLMCINGEEIRASRSGIYELQNGIMLVSFFSVVAGAAEQKIPIPVQPGEEQRYTDIVIQTEEEINEAWNIAEQIPDVEERERAKAAIGCRCLFNTIKVRTIDSFTLDYLYREE